MNCKIQFLYLSWGPCRCDSLNWKVTHLNNLIKELSSQEVEYGKAAVAPTNTEKAGYNFKNWDKEFSNITSHLVVNAVYEAAYQPRSDICRRVHREWRF